MSRRVPTPDVLTIRSDYALRRNAEQMLRLASDILDKTPTCEDHAARLGISGSGARMIAKGRYYKDVMAS